MGSAAECFGISINVREVRFALGTFWTGFGEVTTSVVGENFKMFRQKRSYLGATPQLYA